MKKRAWHLFLLSTIMVSLALGLAQTTSYDVASIKPNKSGSQSSGTNSGHGRLTATNVTLRSLIRNAYRLQDFQLVNLPSWVDSDRFDIAAKADRDPSPAEEQLMLRALLEERFKLATHHEAKEMGVYNLVLAKPDGTLGSDLRRVDCAKTTCGGTSVNNTVLHAQGVTLDSFSETLSSIVTRIVNQKTGLDGPFDIDLAWSRDQTTNATHPSIFTALQEQLGLKLESTRGPVDVLVIDHVEPPTPD